jgi:transcription-repair coupling factor (superfamily II helicase)
VEVVVGTHAILAESIRFNDLGLVVVDEEQRFGVKHKERLKALREDVHMLTLTATPIPRTLQMALSGIREMSIIATPPVDRLTVRTYVTPQDAILIREALLREKYRGGQAYYVVPRIKDLRRSSGSCASRCRGEGHRGPRPDERHPARGGDERLLRRPVRRAAVHHHRGERARHPLANT